jgi:hypothetical protein
MIGVVREPVFLGKFAWVKFTAPIFIQPARCADIIVCLHYPVIVLQKYAGQQVDNGVKAKAYANGFIGRHLDKVAGGKTYSEVSTAALQDPTNTALQQQKQVLFQGETLRGLLLGDGYAYWTFGMIAYYAALASFAGAAVMAMLVLLGLRRIK